MFSVALSLVLGALAPALPVSTVVPAAAIAVCFAPEEDCAAFAVRANDNAEREILVGAYGLTTGSGIVEALVRAEERGVDVRLIADKITPCEHASGIEPLAAVSVPIWIDRDLRVAHAKTMVIDRGGYAHGFHELDPRLRGELGRPEPRLVRDGRGGLHGPLARTPCHLPGLIGAMTGAGRRPRQRADAPGNSSK